MCCRYKNPERVRVREVVFVLSLQVIEDIYLFH